MGTAQATAPQTKKAEDDLDQIINELDKMQKEMDPTAAGKKPELKVVEQDNPGDAQEFPETEVTQEIPSPEGIEDFRASKSETSMEETLGALEKEEPKSDSVLAAATQSEEEVVQRFDDLDRESGMGMLHPLPRNGGLPKSTPSNAYSGTNTLSMTLTGQMSLKLKYAFGDQEVSVGFEDDYLKIQLSDGTEFKIPTTRSPAQKTLK